MHPPSGPDVVGASRVERSSRTDLDRDPTAWALHPYVDMATKAGGVGATKAVIKTAQGVRSLWATEVGSALSDPRYGSSWSTAKLYEASGRAIRNSTSTAAPDYLAPVAVPGAPPVHWFYYSLGPPIYVQNPPVGADIDRFDSSLLDRNGAARAVICGIGAVKVGSCPGLRAPTNGMQE